jgi:hypothetical protein
VQNIEPISSGNGIYVARDMALRLWDHLVKNEFPFAVEMVGSIPPGVLLRLKRHIGPGMMAVGGIPVRSAICTTLTPKGGTLDDTAQIQAAINAVYYRFDWNNFGRRVGFAWKLPGAKNAVIRGGYGIFFAHPFDNTETVAASLGFSVSASLNSADGVTAPFLLRYGVPPVTPLSPDLNDAFGAVPSGRNPTTSVSYLSPVASVRKVIE